MTDQDRVDLLCSPQIDEIRCGLVIFGGHAGCQQVRERLGRWPLTDCRQSRRDGQFAG